MTCNKPQGQKLEKLCLYKYQNKAISGHDKYYAARLRWRSKHCIKAQIFGAKNYMENNQ